MNNSLCLAALVTWPPPLFTPCSPASHVDNRAPHRYPASTTPCPPLRYCDPQQLRDVALGYHSKPNIIMCLRLAEVKHGLL